MAVAEEADGGRKDMAEEVVRDRDLTHGLDDDGQRILDAAGGDFDGGVRGRDTWPPQPPLLTSSSGGQRVMGRRMQPFLPET